MPDTVWVLGPRREWREDLVPVLEQLRSRGAAGLKTKSPEYALEVFGDTGIDLGSGDGREDIGSNLTRANGTCLGENSGKGPQRKGTPGEGDTRWRGRQGTGWCIQKQHVAGAAQVYGLAAWGAPETIGKAV